MIYAVTLARSSNSSRIRKRYVRNPNIPNPANTNDNVGGSGIVVVDNNGVDDNGVDVSGIAAAFSLYIPPCLPVVVPVTEKE